MEAHHFCRQVNEEFAQCVLFDGNTAAANLNGIGFIISAKLYEQLPAKEQQYWHPHNYEILSGQLVAPGLPEAAEKEYLKTKINSYGKTWHGEAAAGYRRTRGAARSRLVRAIVAEGLPRTDASQAGPAARETCRRRALTTRIMGISSDSRLSAHSFARIAERKRAEARFAPAISY